ncbi:type I-C CRISPR-associated protein Cas8c/Csd1 [Deinococcus radiophilus]|nr:type I-C CRISPR-associated protein Cas8c/Csd1 [Deinococcus radiophilus]UFA51815.1 type I-C CRISPR-associated protein Cas8c/Csd1 [Deinococcus radiophilus]
MCLRRTSPGGGQALNGVKTGGVTFAFWTKEGATLPVGQILTDEDFDLASIGLAPDPTKQKANAQEVGAALSSPFKGALADFDPKAAFYAVGMTPSKSRVAVRTHLTTTVADTLHHLRQYFAAQQLVKINPAGKHPDRSTYDLYPLVSAMYRDARKEHTEPDVDALVQFALSGQPLPRSFLVKLNARNRVDEYHVTRPRAVLTKMVLLSREFKELEMDKDSLDALNPNQKEPAYHLGRLLAVLDDIQTSAMRGVNTTLVDRFYGSMSTTPYAVVGRLIHGSQAHLQKLRKEKPGVYKLKQDELEAVMSRLKDIPARPLTTAQQALFALGYYHQRAHISEGIREGKAAKDAKAEAEKNANNDATDTNEGDQ